MLFVCTFSANPYLERVSNNGNVLGNCQGDCDNDSHCEGDLLCWQRAADDIEPIPGCNGDLSALDDAYTDVATGNDFCYDPAEGTSMSLVAYI